MAVYTCRVTDQNGRTRKLVRESESEESLIRNLNKEDLFPIKILEDKRKSAGVRGSRRFKRKAVQEFVSTLSVLLSSGLTLKDALGILQSTFQRGAVNTIAVLLLNAVSKGQAASDAVEDLGTRLPPILNGFFRIGEKTGSMASAVSQLSEYMTEQTKVRTKMQNSLVYPVFVILVAAVGIVGVVLFIFPRIRQMFGELGTAIPGRISTVMGAIHIAAPAVGIIVLLILSSFLLYNIAMRRGARTAAVLGQVFFRIPVIGSYIRLREHVNFLFAMESLVASGYNVEDALTESWSVVSNQTMKDAISAIREKVTKGDSVAAAFLATPHFSERIGHWCAIGERTGSVERVFSQLKIYYQSEMDKWNTRLMNLIEPVLILGVGIIVFVVIFFLVVPMFSLYQEMM